MNVNFMGKKRHPGEEWLVTSKEVDSLIPPIGVVSVQMFFLSNSIIAFTNSHLGQVKPLEMG